MAAARDTGLVLDPGVVFDAIEVRFDDEGFLRLNGLEVERKLFLTLRFQEDALDVFGFLFFSLLIFPNLESFVKTHQYVPAIAQNKYSLCIWNTFLVA